MYICIKLIFRDLNFNSYPHTSGTYAYKVLSNLISASNLLKYKRKRKKEKVPSNQYKVFLVYTLFCFFENFFFSLKRVLYWKFVGNQSNNSLHILRSGKERERLLLGGGQL